MQLDTTHTAFPWLIRHAAELIDRCAVGAVGRTNYQRRKGKKFSTPIAEFGETVMYLYPKSKGVDKFDSRWGEGIWLGVREFLAFVDTILYHGRL